MPFMLAESPALVSQQLAAPGGTYVTLDKPLLALGRPSLQDGGPAQDREHGCREIVMGMMV